MLSNNDLIKTFFRDLKKYNTTNFRTIEKADLTREDATTYKSFSSVVTRYFIFREKHPEISESDLKILYYKLRIDMIARYFAEYPKSDLNDLSPFQLELQRYAKNDTDDMNEEITICSK